MTSIGSSAWYEEADALAWTAAGGVCTVSNGIHSTGLPSQPTERPGYAVHHFDAAGSRVMGFTTSGSGRAYGEEVAVDDVAGAVYVAGWDADCSDPAACAPRAALWKYDLTTGQELWMRRVGPGGALPSRLLAVEVVGPDRVAVSGLADLGPGPADAGFHAVLDGAGATVWSVVEAGTYEADLPIEFGSIAEDARGNLFTHHLREGAVVIQKFVPGAAVGAAVCSPAVPNSTGAPAHLEAFGSDEVSTDDLVLLATDLPANTFAMVVSGRTTGSLPMVGGGQGTLCIGGAVARHDAPGELRRTRLDGTTSFQLDLDALRVPGGYVPGAPGSTWVFQLWYRDANPAVTSNLSDAVEVTLR